VESTENIPGHFSRRIVKRTLSDESLNKIEPVVINEKPSDSKQNEVTKLYLKDCYRLSSQSIKII